MNKEQNLVWIDYIRVFATISVIFLHVAALVVGAYPKINLSIWWVANFYDSAVRSSVPLFVMLTGALVVPQKHSLFLFLKKRLSRILIPFIFWSIIYLVYRYLFEIPPGEITSILGYIKWIYVSVLQRGAMFHFWYIYMIIGIYLFIPIIGPWLRAASEKEMLYFLCIWSFSLFASYPVIAHFAVRIEIQYFSGYMGYVVLGYFLSVKQINKRMSLILAIGSIVVGLITTALGMYYLTAQSNHSMETAYGNLTPNVMLMAMGIFYLFKIANLPPVTGVIKIICRNSYTIYLAHALVLLSLQRLGIDGFIINPILGIPLVALICLIITTCIAWGLNKSPLGKYIGG